MVIIRYSTLNNTEPTKRGRRENWRPMCKTMVEWQMRDGRAGSWTIGLSAQPLSWDAAAVSTIFSIHRMSAIISLYFGNCSITSNCEKSLLHMLHQKLHIYLGALQQLPFQWMKKKITETDKRSPSQMAILLWPKSNYDQVVLQFSIGNALLWHIRHLMEQFIKRTKLVANNNEMVGINWSSNYRLTLDIA